MVSFELARSYSETHSLNVAQARLVRALLTRFPIFLADPGGSHMKLCVTYSAFSEVEPLRYFQRRWYYAGMTDLAAYLLTAIGLFAAPLLAFGAYAAIQSRWSPRQSTIAAVCALALVLILGAAALGFSFKDVRPNFAAFLIAYAAYCFLAVSCLRIPSLLLRIPALILAAMPIAIGYVLCTIGSLGLMFIVGDYTNPPKQIERLRPD